MRERRRILVVEDDLLVATLLAEILESVGWQVVGPVAYLATALDAAASEDFDAAVLDVNLRCQTVYPAFLVSVVVSLRQTGHISLIPASDLTQRVRIRADELKRQIDNLLTVVGDVFNQSRAETGIVLNGVELSIEISSEGQINIPRQLAASSRAKAASSSASYATPQDPDRGSPRCRHS